MTFNKSRGGGGGGRGGDGPVDRPRSSGGDGPVNRPRGPGVGQSIDASPPVGPGGPGPRNLQETRVWKDSEAGVKRLWSNYLNTLKRSFSQMSRRDQEQLISQFCVIVTMGVAALATMFFYSFLPLFIRVFALPAILAGSYWAGTKLVAPVMIVRYDDLLNKEF